MLFRPRPFAVAAIRCLSLRASVGRHTRLSFNRVPYPILALSVQSLALRVLGVGFARPRRLRPLKLSIFGGLLSANPKS